MTARRKALDALLSVTPDAAEGETPSRAAPAAVETARPLSSPRAGSVRAMGLHLEELARVPADAVVEIDTALCDPSPVRDRLSAAAPGLATSEAPDDPALDTLVASLNADGQVVPALLRPHEAEPGRYRIVYGHRRVAACRRLGRPVRAVIRRLDDPTALLAQGQENAERRDLTFIERALFVAALEDAGLSRAMLCAALSVHTSEASRLLQVGHGIPRDLAARIGPAPKIGRPRWLRLMAALGRTGSPAPALKALSKAEASQDDTARFDTALAALEAPPDQAAPRPTETTILTTDGHPLARLAAPASKAAPLKLVPGIDPDFGAYLAKRLPDLYAAWQVETAAGEI